MEYTTTSSGSDSGSSDLDGSYRYQGYICVPSYGFVDEKLEDVQVVLKRLDPYGMTQRITDTQIQGLIMHVNLVSEDGTIDCDLTDNGDQLLYGKLVAAPTLLDNQLIFKFTDLRVRRTGMFRIKAKMFNIMNMVVPFSSSWSPPAVAAAAAAAGSLSSSIYTDISDVLIIT